MALGLVVQVVRSPDRRADALIRQAREATIPCVLVTRDERDAAELGAYAARSVPEAVLLLHGYLLTAAPAA